MKPHHPFEWINESALLPTFVIASILSMKVMIALQVIGDPLKNPAAPQSIVSFEFAGDIPTAQQMLDSWDPTARIYAGLSLGLDYLFLIAYPTSLGLGCVLVSRRWSLPSTQSLGLLLSWLQLTAGLLDAIENYALIQLLLGSQADLWPLLAKWCAIPKFAFVAAGLFYVLCSCAFTLRTPSRHLHANPLS